jgi:hypothetical protein
MQQRSWSLDDLKIKSHSTKSDDQGVDVVSQ